MTWARTNLKTWAALSLAVAMAAALLALVMLAEPAQSRPWRGADLSVKKTVNPKVVRVGRTQAFNITVRNRSHHRVRHVVLRDPLPGIVRFVNVRTSRRVPGSCGLTWNRTVVCNLGTLRPGRTVRVRILVRPVFVGRYVNRVFVSPRRPFFGFSAGAPGQGGPTFEDEVAAEAVK